MIDVSKLNPVELAELAMAVAGEQLKQAAHAAAIAGARGPAVASESAAATITAPTKYLNRKEVAERMGCREITITRKVARGVFPKPLDHAPREHARWRESEIEALRLAQVDAKEVAANLRRQIRAENSGRRRSKRADDRTMIVLDYKIRIPSWGLHPQPIPSHFGLFGAVAEMRLAYASGPLER